MNHGHEGHFRAGTPRQPGAVLPPPRGTLLAAFYDNPILWKHIRSRLRSQHLWPSIVVIFILCACIVWGTGLQGASGHAAAFIMLLVLQSALLLLMGTSQVAAAVAHAKESGVLDFHRVSPLPASWVALGFLLGAPVREYVLFACTVPFSLFCVLVGGVPTFAGLVSTLAFLVLSSVMFHALGLVAGLVSKRPRGSSGAVVGLVILVHIFASNISLAVGILPPAFLTVIPTAQMALRQARDPLFGPGPNPQPSAALPTFYGLPLPASAQSLIYQTPVLIFLFLAAVRKMRSERAPLYSKGLAVAFLSVLALLTMGGLWDFSHRDPNRPGEAIVSVVVVMYTLFLAGILLLTSTTPSASDISNGLRRAAKFGRKRLSVWSDLAPNHVVVVVFCAVMALSSLATLLQTGQPPQEAFWMCTGVAVLSLAQFGLAKQYFELSLGKRAQPFFLLYLFLYWLVPLLVGTILGTARAEAVAPVIFSLSPLLGIGAAAAPESPFTRVAVPGFTAPQLAAFVSSAALTVLFGYLSITALRKLEAQGRMRAEWEG